MTVKESNTSRHYDTLILGAGMSGLSCAARLYEHPSYRDGSKKLKALEGRRRIGGRVEAIHVDGCRLDCGANWIHGIGTKDEPNPLVQILPNKRYRQLSGTVVFRPSIDDSGDREDDWVQVDAIKPLEPQNATVEGKADLVIPAEHAGPLMGSLWGMIGSLHERAVKTSFEEAKHTTMLRAIAESDELQEAFDELPEELHPAIAAMPQFVEGMEAAPLVAQSAEHSAGKAGMSLAEFEIDDFDGDQVFLQDGYAVVIDEVAKHLVKDQLVDFGVIIEQIDWSEDPIKVRTSQGTYTAHNIVCSLPLGVLQHHLRSPASKPLFRPPLPSDKREAVQSLGFGTLDKIMLVYKDPWWTQEPYTSILKPGLVNRPVDTDPDDPPSSTSKDGAPDAFFGFTPELPGISIHPKNGCTHGPRVLSLINLHALTGFPVLSCFVSCANALQIEAMTTSQASGIVHRSLCEWFGQDVPHPSNVHVTRWHQDEFSRGSYSHMITGVSEKKHREEFAKPLRVEGGEGRVRFVGEHTSKNHFATVHGALMSGWREADAMLEAESSE